jgi:hypothetical protein
MKLLVFRHTHIWGNINFLNFSQKTSVLKELMLKLNLCCIMIMTSDLNHHARDILPVWEYDHD